MEQLKRNKDLGLCDYLLINRYADDKEWIYFGGNPKDEYSDDHDGKASHHANYFLQSSQQYLGCTPYVPKEHHCLCGVAIKQNCFIFNKKTHEIKVIGNCCIKKFNLQGRTCFDCGAIHKNRKDNMCNECRLIKKETQKKLNYIKEGRCPCGRKKKYPAQPRCMACWRKDRPQHVNFLF
jgi:hypothetical protein